ncbi:MAG TPA: hypothetical protein VEB40_06830 [Flavipsychrobacter sp.]|nr:hypothetical protein [Flavipsychrobacter sp.]
MLDLLWPLIKWGLLIYIIWAFIRAAIAPNRKFEALRSAWYHLFEEQSFSSKDFYKSVTAKIEAKGIKGAQIDMISYGEEWFLSGKRIYLQILRDDSLFLVCAAPFGPDFFVSYRSGEPFDRWRSVFIHLPFVGKYLERAYTHRTFFQIDTDTMFRELVHQCVLKTIDELTSASGIRQLSEPERRLVELPLNTYDI